MRILLPLRIKGYKSSHSILPSTLLNELISYWKLDEESGIRYDSVGDKHLSDNATVGFAAGKNNNAALFVRAANEYLSRNNVQLTPNDGSFTVSLWEYFADAATNRAGGLFVLTADSSLATIVVSIYNASDILSNYVTLVSDGIGTYVIANYIRAGLVAGWHHIITWYDASDRKVRISIDGSTISGGEISAALAGSTRYTVAQPLWIGRHPALAFKEGRIDEVGVWSRALTDDERLLLYKAGAGRFYPFS